MDKQIVIPIVGLVVSFGLPLLLVVIILYYKHRKQRMNHDTIVRLAEKGLPVPPELLEPQLARRPYSSGLRGGLVLVGLGIALSIFLAEVNGPWSIGLIPGLMGIALLIAWKLESREKA